MQTPPASGQQQAPPVGAVSLPVGKLLAWAEAHDTKFVARKGEQARTLLRELRGLYAKAEEIAQADAEEQRLLDQLAELRDRREQLRPRRKSSGYDQAVVREWAKANGHTVSGRGSIPASVVQAWREAQAGGAQ
ncbi:histone-like nucleoid-structuring protein Lsr2 [Streptomyces sp. NPDC057136]|uniref:Lsr2 family DNA-binding protein n=1 Tax=Streptomyces sp. NPDC057136 TaxID=3346029 RepID=UPI00362AF20F